MNKGNHFKTLPDSTIMFICTFDPYELELCQYTFTEQCHEADLELDDGTTKIFFNATYKGDDIPEKLAELYRYIDTGEATGELSKRIDAAVEKGHRNEAWRGEFMKEWVVLMDAKQEGIEEGIEIGRKQAQSELRKEKKRADEAETRALNSEARVKELEAMLAEAGLMKNEE